MRLVYGPRQVMAGAARLNLEGSLWHAMAGSACSYLVVAAKRGNDVHGRWRQGSCVCRVAGFGLAGKESFGAVSYFEASTAGEERQRKDARVWAWQAWNGPLSVASRSKARQARHIRVAHRSIGCGEPTLGRRAQVDQARARFGGTVRGTVWQVMHGESSTGKAI
jgi:hypothetical protein